VLPPGAGPVDLSTGVGDHYICRSNRSFRPPIEYLMLSVCQHLSCFLPLAAAEPAGPAGPLQLLITYFPMVLIVLAAWLLLYRPERERMRRQRELLAAIKKNDRVITAAGICGTVASVDREHDRVILKVDEGSGAKITCTLASVNQVLTETDAGPTGGQG